MSDILIREAVLMLLVWMIAHNYQQWLLINTARKVHIKRPKAKIVVFAEHILWRARGRYFIASDIR